MSPEDVLLTREVGSCVIDWISDRLSNYHARAPALGGVQVLGGLVDVMAFAAMSRGASKEQVGDMMVSAIISSVDKGEGACNAAGLWVFVSASTCKVQDVG